MTILKIVADVAAPLSLIWGLLPIFFIVLIVATILGAALAIWLITKSLKKRKYDNLNNRKADE